MIDYFTQFAEVIPICDTKAETIAKVIFKDWICGYSVPHVIHSDQGQNVDSNMIINMLCKLFDVDKSRTTPFCPQCNGATERIHQTLNTMLKCFPSTQKDWDKRLPSCLLAYRCSMSSSTGYSPFELLFGRAMTLPIDILFALPDESTQLSDFVSSLRLQLQNIFDLVESRWQLCKSTSRRVYASKHKTGSDTMLQWPVGVALRTTQKYRGCQQACKLAQPWTGPYCIL